ncbi:VPLPA-CTERM sorting domain-containing protein [Methylomonas sp. MgM2]
MTKKILAQAVTLALSTLAFSSTASAGVTTMYNATTGVDGSVAAGTVDPFTGGVYSPSYYGQTDGWANGAGEQALTNATTPAPTGWTNPVSGVTYDAGARVPVGYYGTQNWVGTASPTTAAFGYAGAHMNWGIEITGGQGGTGTISAADSFSRYGIYADIDTAKGAWAATNVADQGGWRHDLDVGLFKSDTTGTVTLTAQGILNPNAQYGFTIFHGMDNTTGYMHHVSWNIGNNTVGITDASNPYIGGTYSAANYGTNSGTGLANSDIVAASVGVIDPSDPFTGTTDMNTITFNAVAGEYYTIFLGGYMGGAWFTTTDGYSLTVSQVPVPATVWLFGSALTGLVGMRRRKTA